MYELGITSRIHFEFSVVWDIIWGIVRNFLLWQQITYGLPSLSNIIESHCFCYHYRIISWNMFKAKVRDKMTSVRIIAPCDCDLPLLSSDSRGYVLKTFFLINYLNTKAMLLKFLLRELSPFVDMYWESHLTHRNVGMGS